MSLLDVHDIHAAYGSSRVLFGISLEVAQGECVCLLGRNGMGKTTTMRAIMGLTPPSAGRVVWKGQDIAGWPPFRIARAGIGFVPEDRRIFAELSVLENLEVAGQAAGRPGRWTIGAVFALFPKLADLANRQGGYLSGGEQQMLTIGRTLMGNPELLLLDEPSEGLAPLVVENLLEQVERPQARGPHHPARRAGRRLLARARRSRLRAGEGRRALLGSRRRTARQHAAARRTARAVICRINGKIMGGATCRS